MGIVSPLALSLWPAPLRPNKPDFTDDNLTHGDAMFVNASVASSSKIAFVNSVGNAIIKVDNTSFVEHGDRRNTVRIASDDRYAVGSLWIADMLHVPYGVSETVAQSEASSALTYADVFS